MTPTEETAEARRKLGLTRAEFARMLGVRPAQVRKWEAEGQPDPSAAALAAMRLALALEEQRGNPRLTPMLWSGAQFALDGLRAMAEKHEYHKDYPVFVSAIQVLRSILAQKPGDVGAG